MTDYLLTMVLLDRSPDSKRGCGWMRIQTGSDRTSSSPSMSWLNFWADCNAKEVNRALALCAKVSKSRRELFYLCADDPKFRTAGQLDFVPQLIVVRRHRLVSAPTPSVPPFSRGVPLLKP